MGAVRKLYTRVVPDDVVVAVRAAHPKVVARTIAALQADSSGPARDLVTHRRSDIEFAVAAGLCAYCELLRGNARSEFGADPLFKELGRVEALRQADGQALTAVLDVAAHETWNEVNKVAADYRVSARGVRDMIDLLFEQMSYLKAAVAQGQYIGHVEHDHDRQFARRRLAAQLLGVLPTQDLTHIAGKARWTVPQRCVVMVTRASEDLESMLADTEALVANDKTGVAAILCAAQESPYVTSRLLDHAHKVVVRSPVGSPTEAAQMRRIAERGLALVDSGLIDATGVVDCEEFGLLLWLSADPLLRSCVQQRVLRPLETESPWRRRALERTLLLKLRGAGTAPAIAEELGMHAQSVRHRLRRLRELFGDDLNDPERALEALLVLSAQEKFSDE